MTKLLNWIFLQTSLKMAASSINLVLFYTRGKALKQKSVNFMPFGTIFGHEIEFKQRFHLEAQKFRQPLIKFVSFPFLLKRTRMSKPTSPTWKKLLSSMGRIR